MDVLKLTVFKHNHNLYVLNLHLIGTICTVYGFNRKPRKSLILSVCDIMHSSLCRSGKYFVLLLYFMDQNRNQTGVDRDKPAIQIWNYRGGMIQGYQLEYHYHSFNVSFMWWWPIRF